MNNIWILALLFFAISTLYAQDIKTSERISVHHDEMIDIVGKVGENIIILRNRPETIELVGYDTDMKEQFSKKIDLGNKRSRTLKLISDKEHFTIISKFTKRNKIHLLAHKYDKNANLIDSSTIKILELRGTTTFSRNIAISRNKKHILIHDTDLNSKLFAMVFDLESMVLLWNKTFRPSTIEYEKDFLKTLVDNEANAYFIFEKDNRRTKKEDSRFEIFQYLYSLNKPKQYNVSLGGKLWFDVDFIYDDLHKNLLAAGLFTDNKFGEANGSFFLKINPGQPDEAKLDFKNFDTKFITSIIGKEIKKNEGFGEIDIQDLVLRSDGGLLLVTERNRKYSRRAYSYNNFETLNPSDGYHVDYYYNDIALFSIAPSGDIQWKEILRKRQYSQDDGGQFSSYFLMKGKHNLRFLYNDEIKYDTNVNEYLVSGTGSYNRNSVLNTDKDNLSLLFKDALQISSSAIVVPSLRRGDLKLVRIEF